MSMSVTTTFNLTPTLYKILLSQPCQQNDLCFIRLAGCALNLLVRSFIYYQNCEHDILKNE